MGAAHAPAKRVATPKLTVTISKSAFKVVGPHRLSAGRVDVTLIAKQGEQEVGFARLHKGYTYADAGRDFATFFGASQPTPAAMRAIRRIAHRVTFYGGIDSGSTRGASGSVVLSKPGTYLVLDDENGPGQVAPVKLHVTKPQGTRATPTSSATVTTRNSKRFGGATTLPAKGTITFKNTATNSPHFFNLQQVKKGTTRKQILKALRSNSDSAPSFALPANIGTDVTSPGQSQTLTYSLPKGEYAEMCFFPDLQSGMPHALMGMVRIVHLK